MHVRPRPPDSHIQSPVSGPGWAPGISHTNPPQARFPAVPCHPMTWRPSAVTGNVWVLQE